MMHKVQQLENALIAQRKKSNSLEHQLSAAQDRIGGAERKAKALDNENEKIRGELKFWNEVYTQDTGITMPSAATPSLTSPAVSIPIPTPSLSTSVPNASSQ